MAVQDTVTLGTEDFAKTVERPTSSERAVAGLTVGNNVKLTISHETSKTGIRSSAIILDDTDLVTGAGDPVPANNRLLLKLQFNPLSGRTDATAVIVAQRARLVAILADDALWAKFINSEH